MRARPKRLTLRLTPRRKLWLVVAASIACALLRSTAWPQSTAPAPARQSAPASAQSAPQAPDADAQRQQAQLDGAKRELDQIEQMLGDAKLDDVALTKLRDRLDPLAQQLATFIASSAPKVNDLNQRLALLTPKSDGKGGTQDIPETPDSARLREQVTASRDAAVGFLAAANSLQVQAGQLATRIADRRRALFTERTFQQSPSIISPSLWETVLSTAPLFGGLLAHTLLGWLRGLPAEMDAQKMFELAFAAFLAFLAAWPGRR